MFGDQPEQPQAPLTGQERLHGGLALANLGTQALVNWPWYMGGMASEAGAYARGRGFDVDRGVARMPGGQTVLDARQLAVDQAEANRMPPLATAIADTGLMLGLEDFPHLAAAILPAVSRGGLRGARGALGAADDVADTVVRAQPTAPFPDTGARRSIVNEPLRYMDPADALDEAMTGKHLKQSPAGQYVGAPRGVAHEQHILQMRATYDDLVDQGIEVGGESWYGRAQEGIKRIAGPNPEAQSRLARKTAVMSPEATPETEHGFMLTGHNRVIAGEPPGISRTGRQDRSLREIHVSGETKLGKKVNVYAENLDPNTPPTATGTNDIWQSQAFGYTNPDGTPRTSGLSDQEHSFLDAEGILAAERANLRSAGGRTDWTVPEIQAAAWVPMKARSLMAKRKGLSWDDALREANKTQADYHAKHGAYITSEVIPYAQSGHMQGLVDAPLDIREGYARDPRQSWTRNDRDVLLDSAGFYHEPGKPALGQYTSPGGGLETNPATATRVQVPFEADAQVGRTVPASTGQLLDESNLVRGYVDTQGGVPWHMAMPEGQPGLKKRGMEGLLLEHGPLGEQQMKDLVGVADAAGFGGESGFLASRGGSSAMQSFSGVPVTKKQAIAVAKAVDDVGLDATLRRARVEGGYSSLEDELLAMHEGSGKATDKLLADVRPELLDKLDANPDVREVLRAKYEAAQEYAKTYEVREDVMNALRIVSERGFHALREARKAGVALPAVALPALLIGLGSSEEGST